MVYLYSSPLIYGSNLRSFILLKNCLVSFPNYKEITSLLDFFLTWELIKLFLLFLAFHCTEFLFKSLILYIIKYFFVVYELNILFIFSFIVTFLVQNQHHDFCESLITLSGIEKKCFHQVTYGLVGTRSVHIFEFFFLVNWKSATATVSSFIKVFI